MHFILVPVRTSTPKTLSCRSALAESSSENWGKNAWPGFNHSPRRAWKDQIRLKSFCKTVRVNSANNAPANSTPVGPPPTTTMVIHRSCSAGWVALSAFSNASRMWLRMPTRRQAISTQVRTAAIPGGRNNWCNRQARAPDSRNSAVFSSSLTIFAARSKPVTWSSCTVTFGWLERMERIGCAISGAERPAVAT